MGQVVRILACLLFALAGPAAAQPVLERVVMVSRHGVRSPIKAIAVLDAMTRRGWPKWPVAAGEMTPHGAKNLALMADWLRGAYTVAGALPPRGCPAPGAVAIWADAADNRTRQSGDIFAERLAPGCGLVSHFAPAGRPDPLFDATLSNTCPIGPVAAAEAALKAETADDLLRPQDRIALTTLQKILAPDACTGGAGICIVPEVNTSRARTVLALRLGGTIAEGLYLQYVQGMPLADIGWGGVSGPETIDAIMPIRERAMDVLRREPTLAARRGALMARTIVALLKGDPPPEGAPRLGEAPRVVMIAGHDSNLLYMAALMGLDWTLPGQPSVTAPDTTLAFELWRDGAGDRSVRIKVYAQTLSQLRDATPLDGAHRPDIMDIFPDACGARQMCSVEAFAADIGRRLRAICRR